MVDNYNIEDFERLKQEVETLVGRSVKTPKDFVFSLPSDRGICQ